MSTTVTRMDQDTKTLYVAFEPGEKEWKLAMPARDLFDSVWDTLAIDGWCDWRGGSQYQRVRAEWEHVADILGDPAGITTFIRMCADTPELVH